MVYGISYNPFYAASLCTKLTQVHLQLPNQNHFPVDFNGQVDMIQIDLTNLSQNFADVVQNKLNRSFAKNVQSRLPTELLWELVGTIN